jgi:hypothetical protein
MVERKPKTYMRIGGQFVIIEGCAVGSEYGCRAICGRQGWREGGKAYRAEDIPQGAVWSILPEWISTGNYLSNTIDVVLR